VSGVRLDLGEVATRRARLDAGLPLGEAVAPLDAEVWAVVEEQTLARLADDLDRGDGAALATYRAAYAAELALVSGSIAPFSEAQAPAPRVAPPASAAAIDVDATVQADARVIAAAIAKGALPFDPEAKSAIPAAVSTPAERSGATEEIDLRKFHAEVAEIQKASTSVDVDSTVQVGGSAQRGGRTEPTREVDLRSVRAAIAGAPHPFSAPGEGHAPPAVTPPQVQSGETVAAPVGGLRAQFAQAAWTLPISMERFAEIKTELLQAVDSEAVLAGYGLTALQWTGLNARATALAREDLAVRVELEVLTRKRLG
jgi:hypothetical protein